MSRKVLFSAVKNEGSTLLEWVAYHRLIGFDTIYIASNDCTDGTDALLDAMEQAELIAKHLPHKPDPRFGPQRSAIMALNKSGLLQDGDWFAFLDADEYLNIHLGDGYVDDLIVKLGRKKGMIIPWRLFGDGGTTGVIQRQVSEDFSTAEKQPSGKPCHVKSIFRYERGVLGFTYGNMHRPQIVKGAELSLDDFLLAGDVPWNAERDANKGWIAGSRSGGSAYIGESEFSTEYAQINHYAVRNPDMFALKKKRGRGFYRKKAADAHLACGTTRISTACTI
ncbi:glycosyltransferase family 2 protein [Cognatishimia sp. MH4019]|uniref:glycosyltransferase family 2 protein n=1 Tax=Cognatishimia sp. MH4019 TaxID=2854030 RepID=UPI001CD33ADF|nr:glycosyltransferase family 2 protein [Cognatishimia sp. MH4019]